MNDHLHPIMQAALEPFAPARPQRVYRITALVETGENEVNMGDTLAQVETTENRAYELWDAWRAAFLVALADSDVTDTPALACPDGWCAMAARADRVEGQWIGIAMWRRDDE